MNRSTLRMTLGLIAAVTLFAANVPAQNLLMNGNFATGMLAPWVPFITPNGTNGQGLPKVTMLKTRRGVIYAAQFNVGQATPFTSQQGGGINQIFMVATAGTYNFLANIGAIAPQPNADAGTFSILIDGTTLASKALGSITGRMPLGGTLSGSVDLASGSHIFEVMITRGYTSDTITPNQAVTDIALYPPLTERRP